jgi:hypothetical protein
MQSSPNLFRFATSELSQDAFIAWLLRWSDRQFAHDDPALHQTGRNLVVALLGGEHDDVLGFSRCEVTRQAPARVREKDGAIDVLARLSNEADHVPHLLVVESKVGAGRHGNQLDHYKDWAIAQSESGASRGHTLVYLKIRDESFRDGSPVPGYRVFGRTDFIRVLERGQEAGCENDIVAAYLDYLKRIEAKVMQYVKDPTAKWLPRPEDRGSTNRLPWEGFFSRLQEELEGARWGYVSNARGGFMALWWHSRPIDGGSIYLQLEYDRLTFRIHVSDTGAQSMLRREWHRRIVEASKSSSLRVGKPTRFRSGRTMCVAIADRYIESDGVGKLDLEKAIANLREAERILRRAVAQEE